VVAFDTGIMDWAKQNPELAVLLGKSPVDPAKLIGKNQFEAHLAEATAFAEMMQKENIQVLDVRDRFQRSGVSLFVGVEVQAELDDEEKINRIIEKAVANKTTMLIYDESGKQVRWLQYRLEELGLKNYVFLKGGTREYFKLLKTRMRG
jgi:rhodanese-related sulfurtransferase